MHLSFRFTQLPQGSSSSHWKSPISIKIYIIPKVAADYNIGQDGIDTHLHLSSLASDASESGFLCPWR